MNQIICLGTSVLDLIMQPVEELPGRGRVLKVDYIEMHAGGSAVNTAIDIAKLGGDVGIITLLGKDSFGNFIKTELKQYGVDIRGVCNSNDIKTSASAVLVSEDGERSFLHYFGTNEVFCDANVNISLINQCEYLIVSGIFLMPSFDGEPMMRLFRMAKEMGKTTVVDTGWDIHGKWMKLISKCMPFIDYFIPSLEEAQMISQKKDVRDIADVLLNAGVKNIIIKLGAKGCYIQNVDGSMFIESFDVQPIDTTGAGDAFLAAFIMGLINKWSLEACGIIANAAGANCIMKIGASEGIISIHHLMNYVDISKTNNDKRKK